MAGQVWRCVLFDLGDTLVDNHPLDEAAARRAIARGFELWLRRRATREGDDFSPDERARLAGVDGDRLVQAAREGLAEAAQLQWPAGREGSSQAVFARVRAELAAASGLVASPAELEEVYLKASQARQRALPGAVELLRSLKAAGVRTGAVSNCIFSREPMEAHLRSQGLAQWLDRVVYTSEVGWRKPRPEPFWVALGALGAAAGEAVFVGDNLAVDMVGATGAGLAGLWLWGRHAELRGTPPGPALGPGTWPDLAARPALRAEVEELLSRAAGTPRGGGRLAGAAQTLPEAAELLLAGPQPPGANYRPSSP